MSCSPPFHIHFAYRSGRIDNARMKENIKNGSAELRKAEQVIMKSRDMSSIRNLMDEKETYAMQAKALQELLRSNADELEKLRKLVAEGQAPAAGAGGSNSNEDAQKELQGRLSRAREAVKDAERLLAEAQAEVAAAESAREAAAAAVAAAAAAKAAAETAAAAPPPANDVPAETGAPAAEGAPAVDASPNVPVADVPQTVPTGPSAAEIAALEAAEAAVAAARKVVDERLAVVASLRTAAAALEDEATDSASAAVKQTRLRERAEREARERQAALEAALETKIREVAELSEAANNAESAHARNLEVSTRCYVCRCHCNIRPCRGFQRRYACPLSRRGCE